MNTLIASIFIVNQAYLCFTEGPSFTDGELKTFTQVSCVKTPCTEEEKSCLEESIISIEDIENMEE